MNQVPSDPAAGHHIPVLLHETITGLAVQPNGRFIDATLGGGGHTRAILEHAEPDGQVLGIDADPAAIRRVALSLQNALENKRLIFATSRFDALEQIAKEYGFNQVDGILLDLGLSSFQLETDERGFSFQRPGPLDMRFNPTRGESAADLVNQLDQDEIADLLFHYGEERRSRAIARAIIQNRPIHRTDELAQIVVGAVKGRGRSRIHPATKTFQALRIAVNDELGQLERTLPQALNLLKPGGRLAVISFHSLEDRIVKLWMRFQSMTYQPDPAHPMGGIEKEATISLITRKPISPDHDEVQANPRSRSARLRIAEKL